ncbi:hypothetical protein EYF80_003577 [Liparis tanakae]|uniref:Uncharacterized protein n=1 Tax=Liparis tanakae TaxID=230148 RepID=A0A4Z2J7V0_9TELE|nr:hypothetical protein EYF80_003577 [Liparis tanakae]
MGREHVDWPNAEVATMWGDLSAEATAPVEGCATQTGQRIHPLANLGAFGQLPVCRRRKDIEV